MHDILFCYSKDTDDVKLQKMNQDPHTPSESDEKNKDSPQSDVKYFPIFNVANRNKNPSPTPPDSMNYGQTPLDVPVSDDSDTQANGGPAPKTKNTDTDLGNVTPTSAEKTAPNLSLSLNTSVNADVVMQSPESPANKITSSESLETPQVSCLQSPLTSESGNSNKTKAGPENISDPEVIAMDTDDSDKPVSSTKPPELPAKEESCGIESQKSERYTTQQINRSRDLVAKSKTI